MPPLAIAAGIGAVASIGGSMLGASASKKAANKAADTSMQTAQMNNALSREIYGQNTANLSPFMQRGNESGEQINALLAGNPAAFDAFRNSTNYQFRLGEGMKAANQGYAARGMLQSGAAMKGLNDYGQNMASNELGNYMNILGQQQQVGLSGANALAGVGTNMVGQVTANNNAAGTAAANAQLMAGQAQNQMYGGIGSAIGNFLGSSYGLFGK